MKVILVMAITLDGKIAKWPDHFPDWTGKEDKRFFAKVSRKAGVVIMGSRTFDTIGHPLPGRKNIVFTRNKSRISEWENLIFTDARPGEILAGLEKEGYTEAVLAGGSMVNSLFAEENAIDEILVTVCPKIFGFGLSVFSDEVSMDLTLESVERLGENLVALKYKVVK
jgi:dihydrofolate reductase